ncbi:hypothetical protein, partial [Kitasatospora sp. NPDC059571]|uniref:hypothetical protein n=1 Tax=Kitasatospora sp. NPDC059571 TaxID=3346871 RepID=UPI0036A78B42
MQPDWPGGSFAVAPKSIRPSTITTSTTAITVPDTSRPPFGPSATVTTSPPSFHERHLRGLLSQAAAVIDDVTEEVKAWFSSNSWR